MRLSHLDLGPSNESNFADSGLVEDLSVALNHRFQLGRVCCLNQRLRDVVALHIRKTRLLLEAFVGVQDLLVVLGI